MKKQNALLFAFFCICTFFIRCNEEVNNKNQETKQVDETTQAEDLSQYERIRASYTDFSFGDLAHYIFKSEDGSKEMDFAQNKDESFALEIDDDEAEQGIGMNPALKDKLFDVYYKNEKVTPAGWDEADAIDGKIIYKLKEVVQ